MKRYDTEIDIGGDRIGLERPTFFIADIAANHDGDLERAKALIWAAKEAGADAAKFQHFLAKDIVSDYGFRSLGGQLGHQAAWKKPVYEIYEQYQLNRAWDQELVTACRAAGIHFMTTPYDSAAIESTAPLVSAFKIGSGDITWTESIRRIAAHDRPVMLACGASDIADVERAVGTILEVNRRIVLMQCNTNYSGAASNFRHVNLRVLQSFAIHWPGMILGLSDHTSGHATVLGAVAFGARVIEKHFTDDNSREGPDHSFAMNPRAWREMVEATRELEAALGDGIKRVEENERETVVLQRRCLRLRGALPRGHRLRMEDLEALRPAPRGAFAPHAIEAVAGRTLGADKAAGDALYPADLEARAGD